MDEQPKKNPPTTQRAINSLQQLHLALRGKSFGERLRYFRQRQGSRLQQDVTQQEVADATGKLLEEISDYERDRKVPVPSTIRNLSDVLALSLDERLILVEPLLHRPLASLAGHMHAYRLVKGFTQEQIEQNSGVSAGTLSMLEQGKRVPHPDNLRTLFRLYHVPRPVITRLLWQDCVDHSHSPFASHLQLIRLRNGLSEEQLSAMCGGVIGRSSISQYEKGAVPQAEKFYALTRALFQVDRHNRFTPNNLKFNKWLDQHITLLLGEQMATLGGHLRFWRYKAGMSLEGCAQLLDVSPGLVSHWESNREGPPQEKFDVLAKWLEIPNNAEVHDMLKEARQFRRPQSGAHSQDASCVSAQLACLRPAVGRFTQMLQDSASQHIGIA